MKLFVIIFLLAVAGCTTPAKRINTVVSFPVNPVFKLKESSGWKDREIESIYVFSGEIPWNGDRRYNFLILWPSGEAFLSSFQTNPPTLGDIENMNAGLAGYFQVVEDEVVLEMYLGYPRGKYENFYGTFIDGNTITLKGPWTRGSLQMGGYPARSYSIMDFDDIEIEPLW
ncbi:MAG: hypothetical protein LAT55_12845 [Opitutales bacterium]|nr:hypothetical protein [Opitutales bacterium]